MEDNFLGSCGQFIAFRIKIAPEEVAAFVLRKVNVEIDRLSVRWFTPARCLIKPLGTSTALGPDVVVLDKAAIANELLWQDEPVITLGTSVKLVVEVVSTNWQNDYARKVEDYSTIGIPEYWVVNYLGLGGRDYIGNSIATNDIDLPVSNEWESVPKSYSISGQRSRRGQRSRSHHLLDIQGVTVDG